MLLPAMESARFGDHAEAGEDHADGAGVQEELAMQQEGGGGAIRDKPVKVIPCPRCQSMNTKFCYYNNYSVTQPRHFCRNCQRYWTVGGTLRNVPVGGGSRKKTRTRSRSDPYSVPAYDCNAGGATGTAPPQQQSDSFLSGMQHLSMLPPPSLGFMNFPTSSPFLLDGLYNPRQKPLAGLQEVPDMQSLFDQAPQIAPVVAPPMLLNNMNFFHAPQQQAAFQPQTSEPLVSVMAKAGLWSQTPTPVESPSWEMDPQKKTSALHGVGGYGHLLAESLKQQPGFWPPGCVADDRLVPHASWDDSNPSTTHNTPNLSPNGSSTTDSMANPGRSSTFYYEDVSQPTWAGILNGF